MVYASFVDANALLRVYPAQPRALFFVGDFLLLCQNQYINLATAHVAECLYFSH